MRGRAGSWLRDLALGFRLAVGGSRNHPTSWVRLGVGAFGIALAVAVLLGAASAGSVLSARDDRAAAQWPDMAPRSGVVPTYLQGASTEFRGEHIGGEFVDHEDATSPVPPGVPRQLEPGEMLVSPELRRLLDTPDAEALRERFADYRIVGELTKDGVVDPADLRFVAGAELTEDARAAGQKAYAFGGSFVGTPMPFELIALVVLGSVVLLVPLLIFIQSSSRIAGAERDRRLSALRLVGADTRQVRRIAAAEALLPAAVGLLLGAGLFYAVRPLAGNLRLFGVSVYPDDIVPATWAVLLIVLAVPLMAVATAMVAMRRTIVEPLGVVRQGKPRRKRTLWWRLAVTAIGAGLLLAAATVLCDYDDTLLLTGIGLGGSLLVLGVASLLPWAVELAISRARGGPPSVQLAARRLQLDSGTSARVVSGIVVVLTGAVAVLLVLASVQREAEAAAAFVTLSGERHEPPVVITNGDQAQADALGAKLERVPGVNGVHPARELPVGEPSGKEGAVVVADCFALGKYLPVGRCTDGDVFLPDVPAELKEPGVADYAPGDQVRVGESVLRIPADARSVRATDFMYVTAYFTPRAFGSLPASSPESPATLYLDSSLADPRQAAELLEDVRNVVGLDPGTWVSSRYQPLGFAELRMFESIKTWIYAGAVVVLSIAALSVLVLAFEQVRERRRALAAVSAGGVGFGTLARSLLWQNAIPFCVGAVLAVGGGIVLAYLVLKIPRVAMTTDWGAIGALTGIAAALVLLVTLLSLPMLRAAVSVKNLRTE